MAIYVTGDTHGMEEDTVKLSNKNWPVSCEFTMDDYLIICGDFGFIWEPDKSELFWLQWLSERPYNICFVDGNHENFDRLATEFPVEQWHGGAVQFIRSNVIHLMRGQIYDICGKKIFTMGGATSTDKHLRTVGKSWWPQEMPSNEEYEQAYANLEAAQWKVDYVFTHTCPDSVFPFVYPYAESDKLTQFLQIVSEKLEFKHWYFGHFHQDKIINDKYTVCYHKKLPVL